MSRPRTSLPAAESGAAGTRSRATGSADGSSGAGGGGIEATIERVFAPHLTTRRGASFVGAWRKTLRQLWPLGAVSLGNTVSVLVDGDETFEAIWAAVAGARSSVVLTTYILEPDHVGQRTLDELERAAVRGCRVLVVIDAFGSHRVPESRLESLRAVGARVVVFNPIVRWATPLSRLVRNHRKIVVVDRRTAFCGGMNIAEEYAGERHGTGLFRDTQLQLEGPCAADLAALVESDALADPGPDAFMRTPRADIEAQGAERTGAFVQILESNVRRQRRAIQKALRVTLARTLQRCYLTSPYFVPPRRLERALEHAARRGVDVRVLTAGRSDVPIVRLASQHLYGRLLKAGVRLFEYQGRILHAKVATVDGVYASVGSFNLDHWSDRRNLEVSVAVLDRVTVAELERQFQRDLDGSREITLESWSRRTWPERLLGKLAYGLLRL
jgi:cardiolipin synthase